MNENKLDPTKNFFNFYLNEKKFSTLYQALAKRMALHLIKKLISSIHLK